MGRLEQKPRQNLYFKIFNFVELELLKLLNSAYKYEYNTHTNASSF